MAFNDQGSVFSTLEGLAFTWTVESNSNKGENVRFIKFRDSTYALEPTLEMLETKGIQGSKVLLEGIRTGSSKVTVKLASKSYANVPPAEVTVMVVANLFLAPHSAFVMQGATVDYHAEQMKSNRVSLLELLKWDFVISKLAFITFQIHRIDLSTSPQYYLEVASDIAKNHPTLKETIVASSKTGECEIYLRDNNVGKEDAVKSPSADLNVVAPSYITIEIGK